jgi:hypothetical protein
MSTTWSVNISDDVTEELTADQIATRYHRGELHPNDVYVWRDGMVDWIPLGQCSELVQVLNQAPAPQPQVQAQVPSHGSTAGHAPAGAQPSQPAVHTSAPAPTYPSAEPEHPFESTTFMADPSTAAALDAVAYPDPSAPVQASAPARASAPAQASPSAQGNRIGARGEASALFSIEQITGMAQSKGPQPQPTDDILDLGGSGGGGFAGAFAPPPMDAAAPPPPPEPVAAVAQAAPQAARQAAVSPGLPPTATPKPGKGKWIAIAMLLVLLVGGGVAAWSAMSGDDASQESATAKNGATDGESKDGNDSGTAGDTQGAEQGEEKSTSKGDDAKGDDAKSDDAKSDDAKSDDAKSDDAKGDDAKGSKQASRSTSSKSTKSTKSTKSAKSTKSTKSTTKDEPEPETKPEPEPTEKAEAKPAKTKAKGPFSRDAARSALSAAAGRASGCKRPDGPTGRGRATVTFSASGRAASASVGAPFAGTSVGSCAAAAFRSASVPPFEGSSVTVSKSFFIR